MQLREHARVDLERAEQIWADYQLRNDLSSLRGQVAAIEPESGKVWLGVSGIDVADRMAAEGITAPVYLIRIGFDHFVRKGRR